jgi:Protein of unknown function (DUF3575)
MLKSLLTALLLSASIGNCFAQDQKELFPKKEFLRFNFLGLLDGFDQNLSIGGEYRFNPNWSTGADAAWIFYSAYLSENKGSKGFIFRPFIRYYPHPGRHDFFEAELHYKYAVYQVQDWIGMDPVNGVPSYDEYATVPFRKNVFDIHVKAGDQQYLDRNKRILMEFAIGVGIRWKWQGVDHGVYTRTGFLNSENIFGPHFVTPVVPMTLRLVYLIK